MIRVLNVDELRDLLSDRVDAGFGAINTAQGCLPLTALEVDVNVEALVAETTVRQRFRNVFDEPLEATYIFPLPPRAAVTGFRMTVNDSVIEGRIHERGKARQAYDAAIAEGRTASIAEQERADVFTLRVGNIPPRSTARIELTLVAPVAIDSFEAAYRFPLVVAPRYCPGMSIDGDPVGDGIAADTDLVPDASRISPPVLLPGFKSPVKLGIRVRIASGELVTAADRTATSLGCTLAAQEQPEADGGLVVSVMPEQRLDRDFILRWRIAADTTAITQLVVEPDHAIPTGLGTGKPAEEASGDGTFSLVIVPPAQAPDASHPPRDVVFMLDRSGSMQGWKMVAARRAVARMVDTLTAADRVAVMAFDNSVEHAGDSPNLTPATDRHRWAVLEWLGGIGARGGTELATALGTGFRVLQEQGEASAAVPLPPRDCMFVLVTDCQVGDEDRVIADLGDQIGGATLFVVGIDAAVNEGLLSRMADATGGMAEMVESEDRLDEVMDRIHRRLATPLVSGLGILAAGLDIVSESLVPAKLPNLVPGVPLVVRGRYRGEPIGGVRIEGRRQTGELWKEQVEAKAVSTGCHRSLWARGRLRHLEDQFATGRHDDQADALTTRMVELSTACGVLCRFTAVVAIDQRHPDLKTVRESLLQIVQPVDQLAHLTEILRARAEHAYAPKFSLYERSKKVDSHETIGFIDDQLDSPLERAMSAAASLLVKVRPKSGAVRDVRPAKVRSLLKAVLTLLRQLGACGVPRATIEALATAYGRLYALPTDRQALAAILDVLADIADPVSTITRWWHATTVDDKTFDDVPF
jgi:Ca-activated chloride channel family protein